MFRSAAVVMLLVCVAIVSVTSAYAEPNISISADPYLTGGLFTNPLLPREGQDVEITVRAVCSGTIRKQIQARLTVLDPKGNKVDEKALVLEKGKETAEAVWSWSSDRNGLYTVRAELDPENKVAEENEEDNVAELILPVIVKGRAMHFAWYKCMPGTRWATCVTSTRGGEHERLAERGVLPLNWAYGGMSWSYYDKEKAKTHPEEVLADIEELFFEKYSGDADVYGFGIDECGGYPGTWAFDASIASMKGLIRARREQRGRFFAVWNGGGLRPELAAVYRRAADLLLLETYLWRALPDELGVEDVYQIIIDRIEPTVRSCDMFQPAYGNHCYTLIALDTSERPDRVDLGEQEQVVRFIRRRFPEMRGIAWYTGGYGGYGREKTKETDRQHDAVLANADRLCFAYFIKPCVTLMRESLWLNHNQDGSTVLTAAVSNIGGVDAGEVAVEFFMDGASVGVQAADMVPAGPNRNENRVFLKQPVSVQSGPHTFEARITAAPGSTVLDNAIELERFVP